jgi:hypothetical protein
VPARGAWAPIDLAYFRNPKTLAAGLHGRALHLASILYSAEHKTDGHISADAVRVVLRDAGVSPRTIEHVERAGLWVPNGDGWYVHDYLDHNDSREVVEANVARTRAMDAERKRRQRERQQGHADVTP